MALNRIFTRNNLLYKRTKFFNEIEKERKRNAMVVCRGSPIRLTGRFVFVLVIFWAGFFPNDKATIFINCNQAIIIGIFLIVFNIRTTALCLSLSLSRNKFPFSSVSLLMVYVGYSLNWKTSVPKFWTRYTSQHPSVLFSVMISNVSAAIRVYPQMNNISSSSGAPVSVPVNIHRN